jgi:hypothetical protein
MSIAGDVLAIAQGGRTEEPKTKQLIGGRQKTVPWGLSSRTAAFVDEV